MTRLNNRIEMTVYTVHVDTHDSEGAANALFVPEGFCWRAFFFGPVWLAWHGLFVRTLVCVAAIAAVLWLLPAPARGAGLFLIALYCGLEGAEWRRARAIRQGRTMVDIVTGDCREDAELHFYERWTGVAPAASDDTPRDGGFSRLWLRRAGSKGSPDVPFGMFPEAEQHR